MTQLDTKLIPRAQEALQKAQASGDAAKIKKAQDKLFDLQDEIALVQQTADEQHARATGLFTDLNTQQATPPVALVDGKLLWIVGGVSLAAVAFLLIRRRHK